MILYLDCANGISGDRLVAALLDLSGARPGARGPLDKVVRPALKAAGIEPRLATVEAVRRDGVAALIFRVADAPGFASFDELIMSMYASTVDQPHADAVAGVADRLRAAERALYGEDDERRHELSGAVTAIELIAAAALLHDLAPERIVASPPVLGAAPTAGEEAAGLSPVVVQLLHGLPVAAEAEGDRVESHGDTGGPSTMDGDAQPPTTPTGDKGEPSTMDGDAQPPTTPTGAALLAHFADDFGEVPAGVVAREGFGAARRGSPGRRDVLRVALIEPVEAGGASSTGSGPKTLDTPADGSTDTPADTPTPVVAPVPAEHVVLETNIDDMSAELLGHAAEALREAGALDVWMTPALMKKGRPGTVLHVLAAAADRARLAELVFTETTTFGLRVVPVGRLYAEERRETVRIAGHDIGVRLGYAQGRLATVSPEYEDCRRAAVEIGRPARVVYEAAQARARSRFSGS